MYRLNITIPVELFKRLKRIPNKSAYITQAVEEKLAARVKARRKEMLASAYREAAREESKLTSEWDVTAEDGL